MYSVFPFTHMHIDSLRECFYFMLVFYFQSGNYFHFTSHPSSGIRRENDCEFRCRMFIIVSEIPHLTCITTFLSLVVSFFTLRHRWPHLTVETFSSPKISPGRKHFLTYKDILTRGPTKRIRRTKIPFPRKNDAHGLNRHRHTNIYNSASICFSTQFFFTLLYLYCNSIQIFPYINSNDEKSS